MFYVAAVRASSGPWQRGSAITPSATVSLPLYFFNFIDVFSFSFFPVS